MRGGVGVCGVGKKRLECKDNEKEKEKEKRGWKGRKRNKEGRLVILMEEFNL